MQVENDTETTNGVNSFRIFYKLKVTVLLLCSSKC